MLAYLVERWLFWSAAMEDFLFLPGFLLITPLPNEKVPNLDDHLNVTVHFGDLLQFTGVTALSGLPAGADPPRTGLAAAHREPESWRAAGKGCAGAERPGWRLPCPAARS